jgi:acyl-CoA reductase-like NAD-dependent aldehyde dehydrogenase
MALPTLTVAQRDEALRQAQAARSARKQLLAAIAAREQTIPAVLDRAKTDNVIGRAKVVDLLKSLPGYGGQVLSVL